MVLDLMSLGIDAPIGRVGVAPLRGDRDRIRRDLPGAQPVAEERLAAAVGAGGIEVAHAAVPGRVEDGEGPLAHGLDAAPITRVLGMAEIDVARAAQGREA